MGTPSTAALAGPIPKMPSKGAAAKHVGGLVGDLTKFEAGNFRPSNGHCVGADQTVAAACPVLQRKALIILHPS